MADVIIENGTFAGFGNSDDYTSPGSAPSGWGLNTRVISGVAQFDPALGTLNSVTLTANIPAYAQTEIFADFVEDESLEHEAYFDAGTLRLFIGYEAGGLGSISTLLERVFDTAIDCSGLEYEEACFNFDDSSTPLGGTSVVSAVSGYLAADFVGMGDVTALTARIAVPNDGEFVLDNVETADAELYGQLTPGSLTVEYDYTPVAAPVPSINGWGLGAISALFLIMGMAKPTCGA